MNNKGFTLMETIISLGLGAMLVLTALYAPITLVRQFKYFTNHSAIQRDISTVITSIRSDLLKSNSTFSLDDNVLTIGTEQYFFEEDDVRRNLINLSKTPMEVYLIEEGFKIEVPKRENVSYYFMREELP